MKVSFVSLASLLLLLSVPVAVCSQERPLRIDERLSLKTAVPGEIVSVCLAGVSSNSMVPMPAERFEVLISQKGDTHNARIRSVSVGMIPTLPSEEKPAASPKVAPKVPDEAGGRSLIVEGTVIEVICQMITFTIPPKLTEGEASLTVLYRSRPSNPITFKIPGHLSAPVIYGMSSYVSDGSQHPPEKRKNDGPPQPTFERGKESEIIVSPLIDPETPDSALLITFRQGGFVQEVPARVKQVGGVSSKGESTVIEPLRYRVTVRAPEQLSAGPVEIEARVRYRGELSEPGHVTGVVSDPSTGRDTPEASRPQINNFFPRRIGIGQAVQLSVDSAQKLGPDPKNTIVVIEQDGRRIELKPELNSILQQGLSGRSGPALLIARVGAELTGNVLVRVYNPARGELLGMSEGVPLEIVDEVLPPVVSDVADASRQDIIQLSSLRQQALSAGLDFREYDPRRRYVTIQATGFDFNPNFRRIQFEQAGVTHTLVFDDYSLAMLGRTVVRVPEGFKPGTIRVTIQNRTATGLSEPVIRTFVMKEN